MSQKEVVCPEENPDRRAKVAACSISCSVVHCRIFLLPEMLSISEVLYLVRITAIVGFVIDI